MTVFFLAKGIIGFHGVRSTRFKGISSFAL